MSKAFKCDRCGRFEEPEPVAQVTFTMPETVADKRRLRNSELCAQCLANLNDFLDYYKTNQEGLHE
jgi:hypothetical protein